VEVLAFLISLLLLLLGAIGGGAVRAFMDAKQRERDRASALIAIVSEVDSLCRLIRHQHYLEAVEFVIGRLEAGEKRTLTADIGADYFTVFSSLAGKLGEQRPEHVPAIVRFYAYAKAARDSILPGGVHSDPEKSEHAELLAAMVNLRALLGAMLLLGEKIATFPDAPSGFFDPWPGEEPKTLVEARVKMLQAMGPKTES
jgi:hypothetical protein